MSFGQLWILTVSVSIQMRRFFVASAALCDAAFRQVVAGAAFCVVAKVLFRQVALSGTRKRDTTSNIVAGAAFGEYLGKWRKLRKSHTCGIWRRSRTKCLLWRFKLSRWDVIFAFCVAGARFWKLLAWKVEEASHEMLTLKASCLKS